MESFKPGLEGERYTTRFARDKPGSTTAVFESVLVRSFTLLPWWRWDGDPCSSSDARVIVDVLETMEAPENGHVGTGASLQKRGGINSPAEVPVHQCLQHKQ